MSDQQNKPLRSMNAGSYECILLSSGMSCSLERDSEIHTLGFGHVINGKDIQAFRCPAHKESVHPSSVIVTSQTRGIRRKKSSRHHLKIAILGGAEVELLQCNAFVDLQ